MNPGEPAAPADFAPVASRWLARTGLLRDAVRQHLVATQLAAHLGPAPLDVLDVGAGQGTQAVALAAAGHRVTALEPDVTVRAALGRELAARPSPITAVRVLAGGLDDLAGLLGDAQADVVLCHGVLMYLRDPAGALASLAARVRPGGLLSLLVRNADGLALRPGLRGDWSGVQEMLDAADGDRRYLNGLGLTARADRVDELVTLLAGHGLTTEAWYGVRCLTDAVPAETPVPADEDDLAALLAAEERVGRTDPYRRIAPLAHLVCRRRPVRGGPRVRVDHAAYGSDVVRELEDRVQREYVVRYGGPDGTPVDPDQFTPPDGVFLVLRLAGEPVGCGGFRRHDARSAEVKRMYVVPEHRGGGLARTLLAELERRARSAGYRRMVLETGTAQPEAIRLYTSSGYSPVPGFGYYRDSPENRCFGKAL